jgi:signal transduction histidine kinase
MWEKIVLNLLSNAFKHTFEGSITVTLRWCIDHLELAVADTGVGIPAAELSRLFERFHRVKGAKSRTHEGTGIGLALVRELVSLHGGQVDIESQEEKGSTFTVTIKTGTAHLPPDRMGKSREFDSTATRGTAYAEEALHWLPNAAELTNLSPPTEHINGAVASVGASPHRSGRLRVLLADDNADMRDYVRRLLAERYDVLAVPDGLTALAAAQKHPPDLVLTDIMMPGLDGFGLLRELKATQNTRSVPVILLSARAGEESAVEGLNAGADDYLTKPFSAQELMARVRTHLDIAHARREWTSELERSNKELEAFSYSVSHDLRAPLRAIDGFSKVLLDDYSEKLDQQACHCLQRVRTAAQKMSALINDLLDLSRVGRSALEKELISLSTLARCVVAELQGKDSLRSVAVEIADGLSVTADRHLLTMVLVNLLGNAWKYTAKASRPQIAFGCSNHGEAPVFYVRDNGVGFDMAYADKLFMPFQRLHMESEFEGTGIGLAIAQRIISRHRGRIWAEAAVDAGATFYFTLGEIQ